MNDSPENAPKLVPRKARGWVWHGVRISGWLVAAPILFAFAAALLMIDREITAPSWVKSRVEARAALVMQGGTIDFGEITMRVGHDLHPRVTLNNTTLRDPLGQPLAAVGEISGLMSPRGLVFRRAALMQEVDVRGLDLTLTRALDGTVAAGFAGGTGGQAAPNLAGLLDQLDAIFEQPALEALEQVRVTDVAMVFSDDRAERIWTAHKGEAALDLRGGVLSLRASLGLQDEFYRETALTLTFDSPRGSRTGQIGVNMTGVRGKDVASQTAGLAWLDAIDAPLSISLRTGLDEDGALSDIDATIEAGRGALRPQGASPLGFDGFKTYLSFDPSATTLRFQEINLASDWGRLRATGQAFATNLTRGAPLQFIGQFDLTQMELRPAEGFDGPLPLTDGHVDLRLSLDPFTVEVGQAVARGPDIAVMGSGVARAEQSGWDIAVDLQSDQMRDSQVFALWPDGVKPRSRAWVTQNLSQVTARDIRAAWRKKPGQTAELIAGYVFDGATIQYLRDAPPIENASGYISHVDNAFAVNLDAGEVIAPEGGRMDIAGSTMRIADVRENPSTMTLDLEVSSTLTAALSILDQPPFQYLQKAGLPVTLADARARTSATITFPVQKKQPPGAVQFQAISALTRVRSNTLVPNRTLAAGTLQLAVDNEGLTVSGRATLDGVPLRGDFRQGFAPNLRDRSTLEADIELSQRFLDAFGVALPPGSVAGRGTGQLRVDLQRDQAPRFALRSDLRGITLALPPIGWVKPQGNAGTLEITGTLGPRMGVDRIALGGQGLDAVGAIALREDGSLDAARFERVALDGWLNAPITVRGRGRGRPVGVEIAGGTVDLRRARFGGGQSESGPLAIALDRLQISDGIALDDFRGEFDGRGGFSGQFTGAVNGAAAVRGTVVPVSGRSAVRLLSNDAGGIARALGLIKGAAGGTLDVTLSPVGAAGTFDGVLAVRGLRLREAPAVASLLDAISVVGLLQQLDGQGLAFDEIDARFRLTPREVIIAQSSAVGPGLGISLDGIYTLASRSVDFQGVISPFYILNQIGSVLTRRGEGLIGFNFNVTGPVAGPSISVNPLSALTPGMFREIFRRPAPELSQ